MANATVGVLTSASLAIHAVGRGMAQAMGTLTEHGVKQVDRLLSNRGVDVWAFFAYWTPFIVGARAEVVVALDWTSFAADGQDTIVLSMVSARGERRAAAAWVGAGGRARRLVGARVTDTYELPVGVVVCVHDPKMDEPWCLAASEATVPTRGPDSVLRQALGD